jgi:hypothetical protein
MMSMSRSLTVCFLVGLTACSNDADPPPQATDEAPDLADVVYVAGTTDEALERLVDATPKDDARQYVTIDAPDLSAPLSANAPVTFEYHLASQARLTPKPSSKTPPAALPAWQRPLREVLKLLGPPRVAYAHGTPYNGTAYFLSFVDAEDQAVLRVFTGKPSYTPDSAAWESLTQARQPLTLEVTSAFFEDNDILADGGPYRGGSFDLSIE